MARIIITGGAGFIGSHLARRCLEKGDTVHIVVRPTTNINRIEDLKGDVHLHRINFDDESALQRCFASARANQIYHLAARTRRIPAVDMSDTTASIQEDLSNLLAVIKATVLMPDAPDLLARTGTLAEYGSMPAPYCEDQREQPLNAYTAALVAGTHYLQMLQPRLQFPAVTARMALVFGGGQDSNFLLPSLITHCLDNKPLEIRSPDDRRDLLYIEDALDGLCRLPYCRDVAGQVINIATGIAPSVREIAEFVLKSTGADEKLIQYPQKNATSGIHDFRASTDRARTLLNWQAKTPIADGIKATVCWYRARQLGMAGFH